MLLDVMVLLVTLVMMVIQVLKERLVRLLLERQDPTDFLEFKDHVELLDDVDLKVDLVNLSCSLLRMLLNI